MPDITVDVLLSRARERIADRRCWTSHGARRTHDPLPEDFRRPDAWWMHVPVVAQLAVVWGFLVLFAKVFFPRPSPKTFEEFVDLAQKDVRRVEPISPEAVCWDAHAALVVEVGFPAILGSSTLACCTGWVDDRLRMESVPVRPTIDHESGLALESSEDAKYQEALTRQRLVLDELERFRPKHALLVAAAGRLNTAAKSVFADCFSGSPYDLTSETRSELLLSWCELGSWRLGTSRLSADERHARVLECFDRAIAQS